MVDAGRFCSGDSGHDVRIDDRPRRTLGSTLRKLPFRTESRELRVRAIRHGNTGPAVFEIRSILVGLELLDSSSQDFDDDTETAVRAFQQSRGLGVDGLVGDETWRALDGARWKLGARTLYHS